MSDGPWRIVVITMVPPVAEPLLAALREHGHQVVAIMAARTERRRTEPVPDFLHPGRMLDLSTHETAVHFPTSKLQLEPLLRLHEPDLALCWGYPWRIPLEALRVPRLGSVNQHPGPLPRHRGPIPMAWTLRSGDSHYGVTWHRMDADLDTGPILAQGSVPVEDDDSDIQVIGPKLGAAAIALLPRVFERVAAGDPGDEQPTESASYGHLFAEDYAAVDWSRPARDIHNQVRAWHLTFGMSDVPAPIAELDGERVKLLTTSLSQREGARRVEAGDGPIWIVASEPA
jgi:methionyl-tRNA formyltransferase